MSTHDIAEAIWHILATESLTDVGRKQLERIFDELCPPVIKGDRPFVINILIENATK